MEKELHTVTMHTDVRFVCVHSYIDAECTLFAC